MMMMKRYMSLLMLGIALAPQLMMAQTRSLSLEQCMRMAVENSPLMSAANQSVERAKVLQGSAWDLEKTEITLSQDPTSGGSPDNAISLSQSIEFPTYYIARRGQLKAETQVERSKANVLRKNLECDVKSAYYQLLFEKRKMSLLLEQDSVLLQYKTIAKKRFEAGEVRRLEWLSAERAYQENKMELSSSSTSLKNQQQRLAFLVGIEDGVKPVDQNLAPLELVLSEYNYAQSAEGAYAQDKLVAAEKAVSVARNGYAPSLNLSLRNQLVISSWNPYHQDRSKFDGGNFMGFEVGIGVPLFYGATKSKVKAAKKDREILETEMKSEQQAYQQEFLEAQNRCHTLYARVNYYLQEGAKGAEELRRLSILEYGNGEIGYVELANALQESVDLKLKCAESINDYNQSVIALERLTRR